MCLGAVVNAGVSIKELERELKKISIGGYRLRAHKVKRTHFIASKVDVVQSSKSKIHSLKKWNEIDMVIQNSSLSQDIKQKGLNIFKRLFEAEAKVHGEAFDKIHLHELGAIDCIIDVFGIIIGLDILGVEEIYSSPINLGNGFVETESGTLPVPAPAAAEILKNVPVYSKAIHTELTTPTGAAIIKELSSGFGDMPVMDIEKIGIGAGSKDFQKWPNLLRIFIGDIWSACDDQKDEKVTVIETNIDDMNPQIFEYIMEKLYNAGALDIYFTQVIMKKGRPGVLMTLLCNEEQKEDLIKLVLRETSTIGLRFYEMKRRVLQREIKTIDTEFGKVRIKFSRHGDDILKAAPEYEDCKIIAKKYDIPLIEVIKKLK